jgi:Na+/proline symporter
VITGYDYFIVGFYLLFILGIGLAFRRMSKNTSDYFRAGGAMPWWITGTSAWIASFTAWTFTGAAAKVYETGLLVLVVFYAGVVGLVMVMAFTCIRFRRMRVVTWMEAVRLRYGPFTEQFYTCIKLPLLILFAAVSLNAIGIFMSAVFKMDMTTVLIVLGAVVTLVAFAGGAWAVLASDFVQMFLVMTITSSTALLVLLRPEIGGVSGLIRKLPTSYFHWTEQARLPIVVLWVLVMIWFKISDSNNMENSTMYLMARSDRDARRMVLIPIIGSLIGPLIWFIPSMAARILHPNLAAEYPQLSQPHEAAFVAVAMQVMPKGLLGLLLCAMLGATVTSMDAGLNKGVGVFVRSFYLPLSNSMERWGVQFSSRPGTALLGSLAARMHLAMAGGERPEKRLLMVGKITTLCFGVLIVIIALLVNKFRTVGLFDLSNQLAASLLMPLALPLLYGMFVKRTPLWSAWSTAVVGVVVTWCLGKAVKPEIFQHFMGWTEPLSAREKTDFLLVTSTFGTAVVGSAWYFFTGLFYKYSPQGHKDHVERFFANLRTPVEKQGVEDLQQVIYHMLGVLCLVYGGFILLLTLIPNSFVGRMCFVFCGGALFTMGAILVWIGRRIEAKARLLTPAATSRPDRTMAQPARRATN